MARARSSGGGAASAWLIVFLGVGFVVCLILSIVFYTQTAGLQATADQATSDLRVYVSRERESDPAVTDLVSQRGQNSVIDLLLEERQQLKALIGDTQATTDALVARGSSTMEHQDTLLREVDHLTRELAAAREQRDEAQAQAERTRGEMEQVQQQANQQTETYNRQVTELRSQLDDITRRFQAYQSQVADMEEQLRQQITDARRERQDRVTELEAARDNLAAERDDLATRIRELTRGTDPIDPPDIIPADGSIVSVQETANTAYIDIGRADGLVLGLTFEVFNGNETVRVGDRAATDVRGKATVEVINVGEASSRVRVVRMDSRSALMPGDQIVNLVYDPNASYRFFVYGDFDIEQTGAPTESDRERIESMVTRWGGQLADDLTHTVDYLVLGQEPPMPDQLPAGEIDPVRIREHVEATRVYERYQELVAQADELSIPVLNQNRFLALIGYYER